MSRSVLRYRHLPPESEPPAATIVALHDYRGGMNDLVPLAGSLSANVRVVAPEAARGVYEVVEIVGRTWFGGSLAHPEPASFGDSLAQVEQLLLDVRERWSDRRPPFLLGHGQGAVLALSLAVTAPQLISGAIALRGCLPVFSRAGLLPEVRSELPVQLVAAADDPLANELDRTAEILSDLGASVARTITTDVATGGPITTSLLRVWFEERIQVTSS